MLVNDCFTPKRQRLRQTFNNLLYNIRTKNVLDRQKHVKRIFYVVCHPFPANSYPQANRSPAARVWGAATWVEWVVSLRSVEPARFDTNAVLSDLEADVPKSRLECLLRLGFCRPLPFGLIRCTVQLRCSAIGGNRPRLCENVIANSPVGDHCEIRAVFMAQVGQILGLGFNNT